MSYAKQVDKNHGDIRDGLRELGFQVEDTSRVGKGFPDLMVGGVHRCTGMGVIVLVEVKRKGGELTGDQEVFHDRWRGFPVLVAYDLGDVLIRGFCWTPQEAEEVSRTATV